MIWFSNNASAPLGPYCVSASPYGRGEDVPQAAASQASSTSTISDISHSLEVTPAAGSVQFE